jgi:hypothetical protein
MGLYQTSRQPAGNKMTCDHFKALSLAKDGEWDLAHEVVQPFYDPLSCRIHGYLHRIEGDIGNAGYWYRRAGMQIPANSPEEELSSLFILVSHDNAKS